MDTALAALVALVALVAMLVMFDLAAFTFGEDSRDGLADDRRR